MLLLVPWTTLDIGWGEDRTRHTEKNCVLVVLPHLYPTPTLQQSCSNHSSSVEGLLLGPGLWPAHAGMVHFQSTPYPTVTGPQREDSKDFKPLGVSQTG